MGDPFVAEQKKPRRSGVRLDRDELAKSSRKRIQLPFSRAAALPALLQHGNNIHNFGVTDVLDRIFAAFGRLKISYHPGFHLELFLLAIRVSSLECPALYSMVYAVRRGRGFLIHVSGFVGSSR